MKKIAIVSLALVVSSLAQAGERFGGIDFHSSMPASQIKALKADLTYLFRNPVTVVDGDFKDISGLSRVDGINMHNWVLNRVKYIVGQDYQLNSRNVVTKKGHKFPSTPLPDLSAYQEALVIMSNIGSAVYLSGKFDNTLYGLKLDGDVVYGKSTRVGILQVGEGLFHERFMINKEPLSAANSISRLGTLFHEARHSDGNSKHTGFIHDKCPSGHPYAGLAACEASSNGSYSLGAYAERNLLKNCTTCSVEDKTVLTAAIADNLGRIMVDTNNSRVKSIKSQIEFMEGIITSYKVIIKFVPSKREKLQKEIDELQIKIAGLRNEMAQIMANSSEGPKTLDPKPEGEYTEISVLESTRLMNQSLR